MLTLTDPIETASVKPSGRQAAAAPSMTTTLYDLIGAIQAASDSDDDAVVVATLLHVLRSRRARWHGNAVDDGN